MMVDAHIHPPESTCCTNLAAHPVVHLAAHPAAQAARRCLEIGANVDAKIANVGRLGIAANIGANIDIARFVLVPISLPTSLPLVSVGSGNTFERAFSVAMPFSDASSDEEKRGESVRKGRET